jgi:hypothetical protein
VAGERGEGRGDGPTKFATFIVRISEDVSGRISGVVEWVRTRERIRVHELAAVSEAIARMLKRAKRD